MIPSRGLTIPTLACCVGVLVGCAGPRDSSPSGFTLIDSSGVAIATSHAGAWEDGEGWLLADEPLVEIGTVDGPEEYQLYKVISGARLDDGRIVLANYGTVELRFYGPDGTHLFSTGNDGAGPGEFRSFYPPLLVSDSICVFDAQLMRMTVFSLNGDLGRTTRVQVTPSGSLPAIDGRFSNGFLLARVFSSTDPVDAGLYRSTNLYARYTPDGEFVDTVGVFPTSERYIGKEEGLTFSTHAPWGRESTVLAVGNQVYFGSSDSYEIRILAQDGSLVKIIRRPIPNPPVTQEEADLFRDSLRVRMQGMSPMWRRLHALIECPATKPAYGRFLADSDGNLWVSEYSQRGTGLSPDEGTWVVFDPEGRMLGKVETPAGMKVFQIGPNWILGVVRGELDVERVQLLRLIKN